MERYNVCLAITEKCNFNCRYCIRHDGNDIHTPETPSNELLAFLKKGTYSRVVFTGGEALLRFDLIKDLIEHYIPKRKQLVIISNGSLLTEEMVEFINRHFILFSFSHDGAITQHTRRIDVLEKETIVTYLQSIINLKIVSVICAGNENILDNYQYLFNILKRPFIYAFEPVIETNENIHLLDGFDESLYTSSIKEYQTKYIFNEQVNNHRINSVTLTDLNGYIHNTDGSILANITDDITEKDLIQKIFATEPQRCKTCDLHDTCVMARPLVKPLNCRLTRLRTMTHSLSFA